MAFVADREVVKGHAQWWHSEMKREIETLSREDPAAPYFMDGVGGQRYLRGLPESATEFWDRNWRRKKIVCMRTW